MSDDVAKKIAVLTSGGDAPGMNAAVRAIVRRALSFDYVVCGVRKGYAGLLVGDMYEMTAPDVSDIIGRGGTILQTARSSRMLTEQGVADAARYCREAEIDALIVIGGDGSLAGAEELSRHGVNVVGIPATIDLDVGFSQYTIGFDTAVNTAVEAIDRVRDSSTSHERCSIIEVMGRNVGHIALWCAIANGAEDVLLPEKYDYDERSLMNNIENSRKRGKKHHLIVNAEGIGDSLSMARRIEKATGIETRATILGYMQRGGRPTAKDRVFASTMGCMAVDVIREDKRNRVISYADGKFCDVDIAQALKMKQNLNEYQWDIAASLSNNYSKFSE